MKFEKRNVMDRNYAMNGFSLQAMKKLIILIISLGCITTKAQQTVGVFYNFPESFDGYTLLAPSSSDTVYLIDNCGYVVHHWATAQRPGLVTYLLENGDIIRTGKHTSSVYSGGGSGGIVERYDWDGNLIWSYLASNDTIHQHHDVEPLPNGNVLILSWGYVSNADAILAGRNPDNLNADLWPTVITEIEPVLPNGGNVVWQWHVWDHLIQDFDSNKPNYGVVTNHPELLDINYSTTAGTDFLHANAINYHEEFDLIAICSRKSSEIYVIDHSTTTAEAASHIGGDRGMGGDFLYRWGNPQNYHRGNANDQILSGPHDIHWIPDSLADGGKFMVFNNGGGSNGSAVNVFTPPTDGNGNFDDPGQGAFGPVAPDWHYEETGFLSNTISGAQRLPNGNTLVCEGSPGHLFELDPTNAKVWDYVNPAANGGNLVQGANPTQNAVFRAYRFPVNYPAFIGKDLTPQNLIEIDSDPAPCDIVPEPLSNQYDMLGNTNSTVSFSYTTGTIRITGITERTPMILELLDFGGRKVFDASIVNSEEIELETNLNTGMYLIRLITTTKDVIAVQKLLII